MCQGKGRDEPWGHILKVGIGQRITSTSPRLLCHGVSSHTHPEHKDTRTWGGPGRDADGGGEQGKVPGSASLEGSW